MAHDDELELTHGDFSRYPGSPGRALDAPLPSYSEDDDDAVTLAMRPLEEQLAEPGPEPLWLRNTAPVAALPAPMRGAAFASPAAAVALPAPPVARAPSLRPPAVTPVAVPALPIPPLAAAPRAPAASAYQPAPSPAAPLVRSESAPRPRPPAATLAAARPMTATLRTGLALPPPRPARRQAKGDRLLLAFATAFAALVVMLGTGAVLYRIGAFEPGSASATQH